MGREHRPERAPVPAAVAAGVCLNPRIASVGDCRKVSIALVELYALAERTGGVARLNGERVDEEVEPDDIASRATAGRTVHQSPAPRGYMEASELARR